MTRAGPKRQSPERLRELETSRDPLTLLLLPAVRKYGAKAVRECAKEIDKRLLVPVPRKRGPKPSRQDGNELYVWLMVAKVWRIAQKKNPDIDLKPAVEEFFSKWRRRGDRENRVALEVPFASVSPSGIVDVQIKPVRSAGRALRIYYDAQKFLDAHPAQAAKWKRLLESALDPSLIERRIEAARARVRKL
jgi:hypothetical protein